MDPTQKPVLTIQSFQLKVNVLTRVLSAAADCGFRDMGYTQALLKQLSQTGVCNRRHSVNRQR